jgi:hypothetical protein
MTLRRLGRSVALCGILWALFAQPALRPYCSWSELSGSCIAGDEGGCLWMGNIDVCW